jgi:hypothetical protein
VTEDDESPAIFLLGVFAIGVGFSLAAVAISVALGKAIRSKIKR